ncbi:hypothetical protein FHG66_03235 [Rubellimicrobium rubrum]|uniref:Excalibur calcium-binding domain-containing protein n=1 Tax=Rubellimicrobium rubrum TaxID=2585369 RepID=A0A5C4N643_9RHOB|nr:hypothetical protein [Rubellimicrobium rubrum]TNC51841.1 hypothetical protein FHG66_03235 [Rubellimicrobium rubrum]
MRAFLALGPVALLAACASPAPYANQGVGFGDYNQYSAQREAVLTGQPAPAGGFTAPGVTTSPYGLATPTTSVPPGGIPSTALAAAGIGAAPIATGPIGAPVPGGIANTNGIVAVASSSVAGDVNMMRSTGIEASPSNAAPVLVGAVPMAGSSVPGSSGGISDEQDFEAVSSRESIESDAARRAQQAAQYQVMQPQALPPPPATTGPNIVEYAINAPNAKGQAWYSRFILFSSENRMLRNCGDYRTPDDAQRDFLQRGGPERDARGLDPDGDGFACAWDPAPFRAAVGRS